MSQKHNRRPLSVLYVGHITRIGTSTRSATATFSYHMANVVNIQ